jgi:hypothetical protein
MQRRAGNEPMKIEQGMSKEEGSGLTEKIATGNAKDHKGRYELTYLRG